MFLLHKHQNQLSWPNIQAHTGGVESTFPSVTLTYLTYLDECYGNKGRSRFVESRARSSLLRFVFFSFF